MREAIDAEHISGEGPFAHRCADLLRRELGVGAAVVTSSCTAALEMTALLLEANPGDEVILPAYTFVSTANAFVLRGLRPVFADVREDTLNIDETRLAELVNERTRAIVVVHYSGVGCEMDRISELARSRGVELIEDNAHGLFGSYRDRPLGSFGRWATLSFHETKNITCGEGGALLLDREDDLRRAEILRDKGTNRQALFRGEVDKYTWVDLGSSYSLSDLLAAYLYAQLEQRESITRKRRAIWETYDAAFRGELEACGVRLPYVPPHCVQPYHMYWMRLPDGATRLRFIEAMKRRGIHCVTHYQPLNLSAMGRRLGADRPCPVTEAAADTLVRLPFYNELARADQERVIEETLSFFAV
ncbi:MAG: dTDP-4-amino-4,6-dideoxygalactose transaminase [Acidobacteria bacterium]|nr:dTDP-4-amino-4,6-dideoxygalactose transaminase [Acidobacteriota bacterium]NIM60651.1 dTDP-4-amino-4,6-dideoxygalactose transaminase [Acidobacteriota bacterium]NIO57938.1 dTDP-4-amino-4,6-dideoxygalactose transaminase [Acidobacteriota bacterium]NIQ28941.1 dTDP-4-amino-4,6-dideoxygalactose transaminase [Acidobacteriota bacterium]NIQ83415.1 dTDP-4-amino-4,6-dideoxygalactose transaminase [Acidobacteriota bacterium]